MSDIAHAWSDDEGARRALALLADHFPDPAPGAGGVPAGAWAAPGRVNLIGEHLDYNGGDVLPMALPHSTFAAVRPRGDRWVRLVTADPQPAIWEGALEDVRPEADVPTWVRYAVGSAWILGREHPLTGVDAALVSCLPVGAGLSSSAAVECVLALALGDLFGLHRTPAELAAACVRAENEVVGAPTGGMDQAASMLCSRGHALHLHCADGTIEQVPFDLAAEGLELLVIDTRAAHSLVDGQYAQRRATCEAVARREGLEHLALAPDPAGVLARCADGTERRRVRHVLTEQGRVDRFTALLRDGAVSGLGELMLASHASLRDDYEVSCAELDVAVTASRAAGALGARMTGGGFGGSAIALVRANNRRRVEDAVESSFVAQGWSAPRFLECVPGAAARRIFAGVPEAL